MTIDTLTVLEQRIEQLRQKTGILDVAVAIIQAGQTVYARGFGALSVDSIVSVASLSKPVFAYAVLQLCERGMLNLDVPLASYLPEPYLRDDPLLVQATARHALSHTTGLPNWRDPSGLHAVFNPGSAFHYSTEGLIYLQTVVEAIVGQPISEYMQRRLFEPFGMRRSCLVPEDLSQFLPHLPAGQRAYAALSLHTTLLDYAGFVAEMMRTASGNILHLGQAMLNDMLTPQVIVGQQEYLAWGLGWGLQRIPGEEDSFWHWGARRKPTRCAAIGYRSSQRGIVILTDHVAGLALCEEVARIGLEHPTPFPAFAWLLPPEGWHADGN